MITGASGFLGQYVVAEALRRGHQVRAGVRAGRSPLQGSLTWQNHPNLEFAKVDLLQRETLPDAVRGVDAVIHLAAAMKGDFQAQYAGTVTATENLLSAMQDAGVSRLIAISSFSVFDYLNLPDGSTIEENSPLEQNPAQRDAYTQTKLIQEATVRRFGQTEQVTILRPGMIYGRDHLWNAHLGLRAGDRLWLQIGANGQMPLTYVENCATAIVLAAEQEGAIGQTVNIVDNDLPTQSAFVKSLTRHLRKSPLVVPLHWNVLCLVAQPLWQVNKLLKGKLKLPGLLVPARLHARFKPLRYSNAVAQDLLHWKPQYDFETAIDRSCSTTDLLTAP
ncbi:MAG: NAD(P)-dependent oxidoreductase [Drouetiella hepatica Uher 2000/2452]|uniref:NAD(P)-dependent oxidoreductase n=1 Tax=Drouetiella hepatica Uher 2000/2452 TaxID=904376 RepID=A0A951QDL7_9CYAN|nr:NAD(P)-dependent oxidoreductase [Drouetiella hepatica Uher 2000/2452]